MKEKIALKILLSLCIFFTVLIVGLELYEKRLMPIPVCEVTINSQVVTLPKSFEEKMEGKMVLIDVNTATTVELESIPGIGAVIAKNIIYYRTENGNFTQLEQLMNVEKIGEKTFNKIKSYVTIN